MVLNSKYNIKCYILFTCCLLTLCHPEEVLCMLVGTNRYTESSDFPQTANLCSFHLKNKQFFQIAYTSAYLHKDYPVCSLPMYLLEYS